MLKMMGRMQKPENDSIKVRVSSGSYSKFLLLNKYLNYSSARVWGRDTKLIRSNLLLTPSCKNYTVLLAFRKKRQGSCKNYFGTSQEAM